MVLRALLRILLLFPVLLLLRLLPLVVAGWLLVLVLVLMRGLPLPLLVFVLVLLLEL